MRAVWEGTFGKWNGQEHWICESDGPHCPFLQWINICEWGVAALNCTPECQFCVILNFLFGKHRLSFPVISRQWFPFTLEQWMSRLGKESQELEWKQEPLTVIAVESKLNKRGKKYYDTGNNLMFAAFDLSLMTKTANYVRAQAHREAGNDRNKSVLTAVWAREPSNATFDPIKGPVLHWKLFGSAHAMYPSTK